MYEEVVDLSHIPPEGLRLERQIHPNAWKIHEKDWESRGELSFDLFLKGSSRKTSIRGNLTAGMTAYCHRCLKPLELDLKKSFHLTYLAADPDRFAQEEVELMNEDLEVAYLDSPYLRLHDMIREQVYLAVPMKFLCTADCRGLCVHCGADLNTVECGCPSEQIDPRWANLKAITQKK
jgi:uncharacterized metal-binding protein YceD (DUF177 family)